MSDFSTTHPGISSLNFVLGRISPPIPYKWNGSDVLIKSGRFEEQKYLDSKLQELIDRQTSLTKEAVMAVFGKVTTENDNLIFEMNACSPEQLQIYDAKFNLLLECAVTDAEHKHNLRLSKENIKNSFQTSHSWMDPENVAHITRLASANPSPPPDARKFIPKFRR